MTKNFKHKFDLSIPRRRYYSEECGLISCPECGLPLIEDNCSVIIAAKSDTDEAEFLSILTGSHFCNSCPVVVFDSEKIEQAARLGIKGATNLRYIIAGIVDFNAIPENKRHLEIGIEGNPVPLVHFLPDMNRTTVVNEKKVGRIEPCPCGSGKKKLRIMDKWLNKKEFVKVFEPYNEKGTQIWVISRIKKLPAEIVKMATRLADLDFIKYVRICDETLAASSENYPNRPKVPITNMNHETAIGIQIIYSTEYKTINFYDINSPKKGFGGKMVDAVFNDFSEDWQPAVVMDWSNGFWDRMKEKHRKHEWIM